LCDTSIRTALSAPIPATQPPGRRLPAIGLVASPASTALRRGTHDETVSLRTSVADELKTRANHAVGGETPALIAPADAKNPLKERLRDN
jgi:hypothetical protein